MKVVMKPIDVIAWFNRKGMITPLKFRIENTDTSLSVIKIEKILHMKEEKLAGNKMFIYVCEIISNHIRKICELKYEVESCTWFLFKI